MTEKPLTPAALIAALDDLKFHAFVEVRGNSFYWGYRVEPGYDHPAIWRQVNDLLRKFNMTPARRQKLIETLWNEGRFRSRRPPSKFPSPVWA